MGKVVLAFQGKMTSAVLKNFLKEAEDDLVLFGEKLPVRKKIGHILIELAQNQIKHVDEGNGNGKGACALTLIKEMDHYVIRSANYLPKNQSERLGNELDKLRALTIDELRTQYLSLLSGNSISEKGGAGLGLIDITRKSGGRVNYSIRNADDEFDYFWMQITVLN